MTNRLICKVVIPRFQLGIFNHTLHIRSPTGTIYFGVFPTIVQAYGPGILSINRAFLPRRIRQCKKYKTAVMTPRNIVRLFNILADLLNLKTSR